MHDSNLNDVEVLLAGLQAGSIREVRSLVLAARRGLVISPNQIHALQQFWASGRDQGDVLLRGAGRDGFFVGAVHAEPVDPRDFRAMVIPYDITSSVRFGGLMIPYDVLMDMSDDALARHANDNRKEATRGG